MKGLFALCAAQMITVMVNRRSEKRINIRPDRLYLLYFFFELRTFIIEPLLLFKKSLLFRLQRLQARQLFIALHGKQCTPRRLKDHKLGFVLCLETRLVFRSLKGIIHGFEALVVGDVLDKRLDFPQSRFNAFQFLAGAVIGAVNILDLLLKIGVLEQVVFREIVERPRRFLEDCELGHGERYCVLGELWKEADGDQLLLRPGEETIWYYAHEQDKVKRLCNDMTELLEKKLARYLNEH